MLFSQRKDYTIQDLKNLTHNTCFRFKEKIPHSRITVMALYNCNLNIMVQIDIVRGCIPLFFTVLENAKIVGGVFGKADIV